MMKQMKTKTKKTGAYVVGISRAPLLGTKRIVVGDRQARQVLVLVLV
jgi:hypothetical protein